MTDCTNFDRYRPVMDTMPELTKDTMAPLKMQSEPAMGLEEYYAAHTDYMDPEARVVFIGICPGFEQMKLSFDLVKELQGLPDEDVLRQAKIQARFGRSMRRNLIELADRTELPALLHMASCRDLFDPACRLMDNTALLPYPVFRDGKNYTGHAPKISRSPMLTQICDRQLQKILAAYPKAVFIPLGKSVDEQLRLSGVIPAERIVSGFPHPSGVNGHRFRQLEENLEAINRRLGETLGNTKGDKRQDA